MTSAPRRHIIVRILSSGMQLVLLVAWLAWLAGRIASDRYEWSQWLTWTPTLLVAPLPLLGLAVAWCSSRRMLLRCTWGGMFLVTSVYGLILEHRFLHSPAQAPEGIELFHWTISERSDERSRDFVDVVSRINADITIGTNAGAAAWKRELRDWLGEGHRPHMAHPFVILTRLPILRLQTLVRTDDHISVTLLEVEIDDGDTLTCWLVDLPSDPNRSRWELATRAREMLDQSGAASPDVMIGDFNTTRDSAALAVIAPGYTHAYDIAGHGYGASFPRNVPLVHIDHVLLNADMTCDRYDLMDPGAGRHRAQRVWVRRK